MASVADVAADIEAQERFEKALVPILLQKLGGMVHVSARDVSDWLSARHRHVIVRADFPDGAIELKLRDLTYVEATIDTHRGRLELTREDVDLLHDLKTGRLFVTGKAGA